MIIKSHKKLLPFCLNAILIFTGCGTQIGEYKNVAGNIELNHLESEAPFDVATYFDGGVIAWGILQDYTDKVTRRFCVEIEGAWVKDKGDLKEHFYFKDGEKTYRNWTLTRTSKQLYEGKASDVVGIAQGQSNGFALHWQYTLNVEINNEFYEFSMDDWMYQLDAYRVFNRTKMIKFGVTLAEVTLFFDKEMPLRNCDTFKS